MELFDVIDSKGNPAGQIVSREKAHAEGIPHRTAHIWIIRKKEGRVQILLQKRSQNKDSFPGCYDTSSAGHIPAGVDFEDSALRELREELGLTADCYELNDCGLIRIQSESFFHGAPFKDDQVSKVFYIWKDVEPEAMKLQVSEVSGVIWMPLDECRRRVRDNSMPHCILPEELDMLPF